MAETEAKVDEYERQYQDGLITRLEKYNKVVDAWSACGDAVGKEMMAEMSKVEVGKPVNSVYRRGTREIPSSSGTGTWIFPLKTNNYRLTSPYGWRTSYFAGMMSNHQGNDFGCDEGTPIYASDGGTVLYAGYQGTYGNKVEISHGGGYTTIYAHCSYIVVSVGQTVEQGQLIAYVGHTGAATGSHLHFEARYNGVPFNSLDLFK